MNEDSELRIHVPLWDLEFAQRFPVGAVRTIVILTIHFFENFTTLTVILRYRRLPLAVNLGCRLGVVCGGEWIGGSGLGRKPASKRAAERLSASWFASCSIIDAYFGDVIPRSDASRKLLFAG